MANLSKIRNIFENNGVMEGWLIAVSRVAVSRVAVSKVAVSKVAVSKVAVSNIKKLPPHRNRHLFIIISLNER